MDRYVTHATFSLEHSYQVPPVRVFAAWAEPAAKARWFAPGPDSRHQLDFRVGGREVAHGGPEDGPVMTFESLYRDIVPEERIVYTSNMHRDGIRMSVSVSTVEFLPTGGGTQLRYTEQGVFLDGIDTPEEREHGTAEMLDKLGEALAQGAGV